MTMAESEDIDLEQAILDKMKKNKERADSLIEELLKDNKSELLSTDNKKS